MYDNLQIKIVHTLLDKKTEKLKLDFYSSPKIIADC